MAINESIWGAPETWVDSRNNSDLDDAEIKVGATGYSTYAEQYSAERIALNDIDLSPCFWGVSTNSMWGNMYAAYAYAPDGLENPIEIGEKIVSELPENGSLPLMLIDSTMSSALQYGLGYQKRYTPVESDIMSDNAPYTRDVVLSFNYQKIMCIPHMIVMDTSFNTVYTTFEAYFDEDSDYYRTTYPYICAITYGMYLGEAGTRIGESSGIVPLIPYTFSGSNAQYETRYEFSANGFSALKTSYITNDSNAGVILSCDNNGTEITVSYNTPNATVATDDTGYRYRYCVNDPEHDEYYPVPLYVHDDSELWEYIRSSSTWWDISCVIDIRDKDIDDVHEYCLKQIAYLGFPFVVAYTDVQKAIGTTGVYLPVFDENGVTTGEYVEGEDALELANAEWIDGRDSGYDPNRPPTPDTDSGDLSNAGNYTHKFGAEGLTIWAFYLTSLGGNGLDTAINAITNLYLTDPDGNSKWQLDFKGSNPDDYIVSLMAFPLRFTLSESSYTFKLGPVDFESIDVQKYADTGFFTFGSLTVPAYGDFRDYAPYTTAELYIPFCGTCDIDMAFFAGRELIVDMYYDIYTGSCAAAIYRRTTLGKTLYKVINGQIGVEIPLSAARMGDYQSTLHALETAQKQNDIRIATSVLGMGITAGATIATGGATLPLLAAGVASTMGVVSSVQKSDELNYQIEHTQPKPTQTTAASTQNNYCVGGTRCMLFIKRAHMDSGYNADVYGRTKGFACLLNNTVNDNRGLTVCSNVDTSGIPATADEINAIKQAFASGVII